MPSPRNPNDPNYAALLLAAVRQFIVPNTQLAVGATADGDVTNGLSRVYVRDLLSLSLGKLPAVNLHTGPQSRRPVSRATNEGSIVVIADYYDAWSEDPTTLPGIRARIIADVERMVANLEADGTLGGRTTSYSQIQVGPDYTNPVDDEVPGQRVLKGSLAIVYNLLPYDVA